MGAVVVNNNKIVGRGFNYAHGSGKPYGDGSHAEISALNNTRAASRKGSTLYIVRLGKAGAIRLSRPCPGCIIVMAKLGVKYIWYSDNIGEWHKEAI